VEGLFPPIPQLKAEFDFGVEQVREEATIRDDGQSLKTGMYPSVSMLQRRIY
jgi:hypothetical protein